ncbi:MAG: hypothetical protein AB1847_02415 [bacterium]
MTDKEVLKLLHNLEVEIASLKQISSTLAQFMANEGKNEGKEEIFSSELTTVSDEVIFLRKKLEQEKSKRNQELDSKITALSIRLDRLEIDGSKNRFKVDEKEYRKIRGDMAANALELAEARAHLERRGKELVEHRKRIQELEAEVEKLRRRLPWWRKFF